MGTLEAHPPGIDAGQRMQQGVQFVFADRTVLRIERNPGAVANDAIEMTPGEQLYQSRGGFDGCGYLSLIDTDLAEIQKPSRLVAGCRGVDGVRVAPLPD